MIQFLHNKRKRNYVTVIVTEKDVAGQMSTLGYFIEPNHELKVTG